MQLKAHILPMSLIFTAVQLQRIFCVYLLSYFPDCTIASHFRFHCSLYVSEF